MGEVTNRHVKVGVVKSRIGCSPKFLYFGPAKAALYQHSNQLKGGGNESDYKNCNHGVDFFNF